jgi:hypothetical protein
LACATAIGRAIAAVATCERRETSSGTLVAHHIRVRLVALLLCCAACEPFAGPETRARADREPEGENCPEGGLAIRSGLDDDDDHEVDDDEVTTTTYLCDFEKTLECDDHGEVLHGVVTVATSEDATRVAGVTCIDGDLVIANNDTLEILGLSRLEMVTGHVAIAGNPQLGTLDGLDQIRTVGGTYLVQGNDLLADLTPIATLARGDLSVIANEHLSDLFGLDAMTRAPGAILIAGNPELASLGGLDQLVQSAYPITIRSNRALGSLAALANLDAAGALAIADNGLATIELPALSTVDGQLSIADEGALHSLALPSLTSARSLVIARDRSLADIQLPALRELGGLFVEDNRSLVRLAAPALASAERIELSTLPSLKLVDLGRLEFVEGTLDLHDVAFANLAGFAALQFAHDVTIEGCTALVDFTGFGLVDVGGSFTAKDNTALESIDGLDQLARVGNSFTFTSKSEIVRAQAKALAKRIEIGGAITIE